MLKKKIYLKRIVSGSFWSGFNYVIQGLSGFITAIIATRYLGPSKYGIYAYLLWLISISATFLELGIGQIFRKYIPRYFHDPENKGLVYILFVKVFKFQLVITGLFITIFLLLHRFWSLLVKFTDPQLNIFIILTLLILIPTIILRTLTSFANSADHFRSLAISTLFSQVFLILGMIIMNIFSLNILFLLIIYLISTVVGVVTLAIYLKNDLRNGYKINNKQLNRKEIQNYASIAYINLVLQFIVWTQSEVFFLGKFSTPKEIGIYSLAFTLSTIITAGVSVLQQVIANVQFELLEQNNVESHETTTDSTIRYFSAIFIPFSVVLSFFLINIIPIIFGSGYLEVSKLFPFMIGASLVAILVNPLTIVLLNDNKKFAILVVIIVFGAFLNIFLDILFIPRFAAFGAAWANFITQFILTSVSVIYLIWSTKQKMQWKSLLKILIFNLFLGLFLISFYHSSLWIKISVALSGIIIYSLLCFIFGLNTQDREFMLKVKKLIINRELKTL